MSRCVLVVLVLALPGCLSTERSFGGGDGSGIDAPGYDGGGDAGQGDDVAQCSGADLCLQVGASECLDPTRLRVCQLDPADGCPRWTEEPCADDLECTLDSCSVDHCAHKVEDDWCTDGGACYQDGDAPAERPCHVCRPSEDQHRLTPVDEVCSDSGDGCKTGFCEEVSGICGYENVQDGTSCDDENACTSGDTCLAGVCTSSTTSACIGPVEGCHELKCNPSNGECEQTPAPPGSDCSDGNDCTASDHCDGSGKCVGEWVGGPGCGQPCEGDDKCSLGNVSCAAGYCDPESGACVVEVTLGHCYIDGTCYVDDGSFANPPCGMCDAEGSQTSWTGLTGQPCDDDDPCTTEDTCTVDAQCVGQLIPECGPCSSCPAECSCLQGVCKNSDGKTCDKPNKVFVSEQPVPAASIANLAVLDAHCQFEANTAGLSGTYLAWASDGAIDALERLEGARGWVAPDDWPIADSPQDLAQGQIFYPILITAGSSLLADLTAPVATGTLADGTGSVHHCGPSAEGDASLFTHGLATGGTGVWTAVGELDCGQMAHIYCFGVDHYFPVEPGPIPPDAGVAFLSEDTWTPVGGVEEADTVCQQEAEGAGYQAEFRAFLAADGMSAGQRFEGSNVVFYYRPDGVELHPNFWQLFQGPGGPNTPIALNALGDVYRGGPEEYVWTGAPNAAEPGTATCNAWTAPLDSSLEGIVGAAGYTSVEWFQIATRPCSGAARLYCLQWSL